MPLPLTTKTQQSVFLRGALLYQYPDENLHKNLTSGAFLKELREEMESLGFERHDFFYEVIEIPCYSKYKQEFTRCFIGLNEPSARPIESLYKVWTTDKGAQLGISQQRGYLMGDSALHINHLIHGLGLEIPEEYLQMPDHLSILFELLAYSIEHRQPEEIRHLFNDHLDWLDDLEECLIQIDALPFFVKITGLFNDFLGYMHLFYTKNKKQGGKV